MTIYSLEKMAKLLQISEPTARKYLKEGVVKGVKVGRKWRITEDAIREFMEHGTEKEKE